MKWLVTDRAKELPKEWDAFCKRDILLQRSFLQHLEQVNPCQQSYNLLYCNHVLRAVFVDYKLKLDIFTYSHFSLKVPVRIMGIPCSVSKPGFIVLEGYEAPMLKHFSNKKGAKLILNTERNLPGKSGNTLPACILDIQWRDFAEYVNSMRSHYRYRVLKAQKKWQRVEISQLLPEQFTQELYKLYEGVYQRSNAKLEKLTLDFFKNFPLPSKIIKAQGADQTLGFAQIVKNGDELIFLFVGFDYKLNPQFDTYINLLLEVIRYGIANNFKKIDLGQTSEDTKLKLGCTMLPKGLYINHSNPVFNFIANYSLGFLSYKVPEIKFHVFK